MLGLDLVEYAYSMVVLSQIRLSFRAPAPLQLAYHVYARFRMRAISQLRHSL